MADTKVPVVIEIDQVWSFWPALPKDSLSDATMCIDAEFLAEYVNVSSKYFAMVDKLEMLYNIQRGREVYTEGTDMPDYTLIKKS